jgi:hypothetical protein
MVRFFRALVLALATSGLARAAEPAEAPTRPKPFTVEQRSALKKRLETGDEGAVRSALHEVLANETSRKEFGPTFASLLDAGVSASLAPSLLNALGTVDGSLGAPRFIAYAEHRDVTVRRAAAAELAKLHTVPARAALGVLVRDFDADVRRIAALGLGDAAASEAAPDLARLWERGERYALVPFAQVCVGAPCASLTKAASTAPLADTSAAIQVFFSRTDRGAPDAVKVDVLAALATAKTPAVRSFLVDLSERAPKGTSQAVRSALDSAVQATKGAAR